MTSFNPCLSSRLNGLTHFPLPKTNFFSLGCFQETPSKTALHTVSSTHTFSAHTFPWLPPRKNTQHENKGPPLGDEALGQSPELAGKTQQMKQEWHKIATEGDSEPCITQTWSASNQQTDLKDCPTAEHTKLLWSCCLHLRDTCSDSQTCKWAEVLALRSTQGTRDIGIVLHVADPDLIPNTKYGSLGTTRSNSCV